MKITEQNVTAAAERLYARGEITKEEFDGLEKEAGVFSMINPFGKNLSQTLTRGVSTGYGEKNIPVKELAAGTSHIDAIRLGILGALGAGVTGGIGLMAKSDAVKNLSSFVAKKVLPSSITNSMFPKKSIVDLMGKAAVPTVVGIGLAAAGYKAFDHVKKRIDAARTLSEIKNDPLLSDRDPEEIENYFGVVRSFSPTAATNPLVASALVNKMMQFGGVDHKLIQDLTSIEGDRKDYMADELVGDAMKSFVSGVTGRLGD